MANTHVKIRRIYRNSIRVDLDLFTKLYKKPLRLNLDSVCSQSRNKNVEDINLIDLKYEVLSQASHADIVLIENGGRVKCLKDRLGSLKGKIILNG